jgi:hypothetical protein
MLVSMVKENLAEAKKPYGTDHKHLKCGEPDEHMDMVREGVTIRAKAIIW